MSYRDLTTRKSLHINLSTDTHTALKVCSFKHKLSMQEIFEELAIQLIENEPYMLEVLELLSKRKRMGISPKISETDTESIFRLIEDETPI